MEDRITNGFLAGTIGGITANVWGFTAGMFHLTTLRFVDWMAIILYGHVPPFTFGEIFLALLGHIVFCGMLGAAFAQLTPQNSSRNLIFKSWLYFMAVWFIIYTITTLFKTEGTTPLPVYTVLSNIISATILGVVQALVLRNLLSAGKQPEYRIVPAMKPLPKQKNKDDQPND